MMEEYIIDSVDVCDTCDEEKGSVRDRSDVGLKAGKHCDECWDRMVTSCRSRSW